MTVRRSIALALLTLCGSATALAESTAALDAGTPTAEVEVVDAGLPVVVNQTPTLDLPTTTPPEFADGPGMGTLLFQTAVGLGLVVSLIYLTLNVGLRKLLGIRPVGSTQSRVAVLERVVLDQKRVLFVIRAGKEVLLVGGAEQNLSLLSKLDAADFVEPPETERAASGIQMSPFLKKLLGRKEAPKPPSP